jgi:hydroxyacylglutathione hydrolase
MLEVNALPALADNYIWIVSSGPNKRVAVVDPGDAAPVLDYLSKQNLAVGAYLITHHHHDHVGGLEALRAEHPAPVYAPASEAERIGGVDHPLSDGTQFTLDFLDTTFEVIAVPGHTLGHIAYVGAGVLLAGDTLFRAGCGRVFEGSHAQMQGSLARLRELPVQTRIYSGHEYTQANLAFASKVEPDNPALAAAREDVASARAQGRPSLPGTLAEERRINPFLRWDIPEVQTAAARRAGRALTDPIAIFGVLRDWKNES